MYRYMLGFFGYEWVYDGFDDFCFPLGGYKKRNQKKIRRMRRQGCKVY